MKIHTLDTTDPNEVDLVREFIITHYTNEKEFSFHRCIHKDGTVELFYGFGLDSGLVASASKAYAYVCHDVIREFMRFCQESPLKIEV